jgi:hypothetical protein
MSAASDKYEKDVAAFMNSLPGVKAIRPTVGTDYPDVLVTYKGKTSYVEVKMSHSDNLSNPRMYFSDGKWQTTYSTPAAKYAVDILNTSPQTKDFLKKIAEFSGIPLKILKIPTTKSGLKEEGAIPLHIMKSYFAKPGVNRYIASKENYDLGKVVTEHYTIGKTEPANYMQAGDDFYRIGASDPFKLGNSIPLLTGRGDFKVRIGTRSEFYEVQAEIKIKQMPNSPYSCKPGTHKKSPFK